MTPEYMHLLEILQTMPSGVVAFSGGIDSSFLLHAAHTVWAKNTLAVTVFSPLTPPGERDIASRIAREIDVEWIPLEIDLISNRLIARNRPDRCYHCKRLIFRQIRKLAARRGYDWILEGSNMDDLGDFRPGRRAAIELGIRMPLQEAGFLKSDIRTLSKTLGLSNWDLPSQACLASRLPFGQTITPERLDRISTAETAIQAMGFMNSRIRDHFPVARIEIPPDDFRRLLDPDTRSQLIRSIRSCGFLFVALDLEGYRCGSMNPPGMLNLKDGAI